MTENDPKPQADPEAYERWSLVKRLLLEVLDLPEGVRSGLLDARCEGDPELRQEIEELVAAHDSAGGFDRLSDSLGRHAEDDAPTDPEVGSRVGPYELLELIGRGGMGAVYLARRADGQFEQEVALKLHRSDMAREEARRRFLHERQILAGLSHPNIARLLDGGVADDGRPYFVMEYVDGVSVIDYADRACVDLSGRLELFLSVCEALRYAHQNLVVHRDIKPGNILVTNDSVPKLLDFGIAKLLAVDSEPESRSLTKTGLRPMTPEYASPEQIRGEAVSTSSDIYQLGLVLYELLAGSRPFFGLDRPGKGVEGGKGRDEPPRPSVAVTGRSPASSRGVGQRTAAEVANARDTTPDRLRRRLAGDLDNIALKAIRPEPERRYGSAGELADDLRRHIAGHPVRARPATFGYRTSKFVRRNKVPLGAATAVFLALIASVVTTSRQSRRIVLERDRAEEVSALLVDLFRSSDPLVTGGDALTVREVLDRGAERVRVELEGQPEIEASLLTVMTEVYSHLGLYAQAAALSEETLGIRRRLAETTDLELQQDVSNLAMLQAEAGDFEGVRPLLEEAESLLRRTQGPRTLERAVALNNAAKTWQILGDVDRAEPLYRESIGIWRDLPEADTSLAVTLSNLARLRRTRDDLEGAEALATEALAIRRTTSDPSDFSIANSLELVADLRLRRNDLEGADTISARALEMRRSRFEDDHPSVTALLTLRARVLRARQDWTAAEAILRRALAAAQSSFGPDHFAVGNIENDLANVYQDMGRPADAETLFRSSLAKYDAYFGPDHANTAIVRGNLAKAVYRQSRYAEAIELYAPGVEVLRRELPETGITITALTQYGVVFLDSGDLGNAELVLGESLEMAKRSLTADDDRTLAAQNALGTTVAMLGRYAEAEALLLASFEATTDRSLTDDFRTMAITRLSQLYTRWGKPAEAARFQALASAAPPPPR